MLIIVIENPMQFTMVRAVPLDSSGAFWATKVENRGESAITTSPQKNRNTTNRTGEFANRKRGESKQHKQDKRSEVVTIFFAGYRLEMSPLNTHANAPDPMIRNDNKETFSCAA